MSSTSRKFRRFRLPMVLLIACFLVAAKKDKVGKAPKDRPKAGTPAKAGPKRGTTPAARGDLSTPKNALLAFITAMQSGDSKGAKAASDGSEEDQKVIGVMTGVVGAMKHLEAAAVAKFGDEGKLVGGGPAGSALDADELAVKIKEAEEKIDGDRATIVVEIGGKDTVHLKKVDGSWKVDLATMMGQLAAGMAGGIEEMTPIMEGMAEIANSTAAEITDGKHATAEAAKEAFGKKMLPLVFAAAAKAQGKQGKPAPRPKPDAAKADDKGGDRGGEATPDNTGFDDPPEEGGTEKGANGDDKGERAAEPE